MKRLVINLAIIIISAGLTNIFSRFLIKELFNGDILIFSVKSIVLVSILPIVLLYFEKDIKKNKLLMISILYSLFYSFLSNYM
jgi:hypothetical protein